MSENEQVMLTDVITQQEYDALVAYLNATKTGTLHNNILDWCATQPEMLARMNKHGLLLTYFAYLLELFLKQHQ